ncbi:putative phage anti-repressor protein [Xenorhabdus nematophila F1]|uniref:BRO-N domain-containing protein n=1 Tax=Xenorhabdus nematophila TaxID=628 RepID=UPI000327595B|nr:BRO family protein [Xenorhabdus nematophila]CCW29252.1 putative phage anti-repressor protein [Xenorhabdus nematophila F1]
MAKNTLMNFSNEELDIELQGMLYSGKPVFLAVEVAKILGYTNPSKALKDHCKSLIKINYNDALELGFGEHLRGIILLTEPDLYRLILRSKLPSAERFQDWVCEDVLPAIRQTGKYQIQPQSSIAELVKDPHFLRELAQLQAGEILKLNHTVETVTEERNEAVRTKAQISRKREATALQRNSAYQRVANRAIREREEMASRFGASKEWASQQALNAWLDKHEIYDPVTDGYPTSYNVYQNCHEVIYPRQTWLEVHGVDIAELF